MWLALTFPLTVVSTEPPEPEPWLPRCLRQNHGSPRCVCWSFTFVIVTWSVWESPCAQKHGCSHFVKVTTNRRAGDGITLKCKFEDFGGSLSTSQGDDLGYRCCGKLDEICFSRNWKIVSLSHAQNWVWNLKGLIDDKSSVLKNQISRGSRGKK